MSHAAYAYPTEVQPTRCRSNLGGTKLRPRTPIERDVSQMNHRKDTHLSTLFPDLGVLP
jgi:hypothetical protein